MAFAWTEAKERAAMMIAVGKDLNKDIAVAAEVAESTLYLWQRDDEFKARIAEYRKGIRDKVMEEGISSLANRMERTQLRWTQLLQITEERGKDPKFADVPGYSTGLQMHRVKVVGKGEDSRVVDEYETDHGLVREERELQQQASKELGQWVDRSEATANLIKLDI